MDLSHLSKNPPKLKTPDTRNEGTTPTEKTYDLREESRVPAIRDQNPFGTCWTFATLAAMESNYLTQKLGENIDLSELNVAWFVYKDPTPGRSFYVKTGADFGDGVLGQGGNTTKSIAYLARMGGPVNETTMPYSAAGTSSNADSTMETYVGNKTPEDYHPVALRLKDTIKLGNVDDSTRETMIPLMKEMIKTYGALKISYNAGGNSISGTVGSAAYFDNSAGTSTNHAVVVVG